MSSLVSFFATLILLSPASSVGTDPAAPLDDQAATDHCVIQVDGRVFVDRPCQWSHDQMMVVLNTESNETEPYVYLFRENETKANASWTGEGWAGHAHDPLGDLTRDGSCWISDYARVCLPAAAVAELDRDWSVVLAESSPPFAHDCLIQVDGETLLDEPCPGFTQEETMSVNTAFLPRPVTASVGFFDDEQGFQAQLFTGPDQELRALGRVTREGDCWVNDHARLCMVPIV